MVAHVNPQILGGGSVRQQKGVWKTPGSPGVASFKKELSLGHWAANREEGGNERLYHEIPNF